MIYGQEKLWQFCEDNDIPHEKRNALLGIVLDIKAETHRVAIDRIKRGCEKGRIPNVARLVVSRLRGEDKAAELAKYFRKLIKG